MEPDGPLPVPCAGCDAPTPYEVSDTGSFGEFHTGPTGTFYVRTHRKRECVLAARRRSGVERATVMPPTDQERKQQKLGL